MTPFADIEAIARSRHGDALPDKIGNGPRSAAELAALPEDRWLAQFTKSVFQAGFNWKVIEAKWDGFEAAFQGFDVSACAFMPPDMFDDLCGDRRIVRHAAKIASVQTTAQMLSDMRGQGGAGAVIGGWPSEDFAGLLAHLKTHGGRLGGTTGQYALRFLARDGYILSRDVVARLIASGVIDKPPTSKRAMAAVQAAFNSWRDESGKSLIEISRTLALSI